jgi:D-alanyl-D-alanine carboxypeptidase/D-alanyl-D-alanine-endopeptidase (penicillin-binding protein 4)
MRKLQLFRCSPVYSPLGEFLFALLLIAMLLLPFFAAAQRISVADSIKNIVIRDSLRLQAKDSLKNFLATMLTEPNMQYATFGFAAMYAKADTFLVTQNHLQSISTASVMKTITTSTALNLLGKDFRFDTKLLYSGKIQDSTLFGNVYVQGGGDPTLGIENKEDLLCEWFYALEKLGIKKINGSVIADESIFDSKAVHNRWLWEDIGSGYGAGSYGLNFHENLYYIQMRSGNKEGDSTYINKVSPSMDSLLIYNQILAGSPNSGDNTIIYATPFSYTCTLTGTIPAKRNEFVIKGAIPDPPLYCVQEFAKTLRNNGILLSQTAKVERKGYNLVAKAEKEQDSLQKKQLFHTSFSAPLSEIIKTTNHKSINLYAECFLRILGSKIKGNGTTETGVQVINEYLQCKGIKTQGFFMEDGSGLSRFNALQPAQLLQIMRLQVDEPSFPIFYQSLPVVGESGTVKNLCKKTAAEGKIRAKSGSMTRVRCYTGYANTKTGEKLIFSIMANNYGGTGAEMVQRMEKIMILLASLAF